MSKRFFVDEQITTDGKYRVLQEDSETKERFGVKDFNTKEEAQKTAEDMQRAVDNALSEEDTLKDIEVPLFLKDNPETPTGNQQDIKDSTTED